MTHVKFEPIEYWFEAKNCAINLYKSKDGEIFTSRESLFRYLAEKEMKPQ